MAGAYQEFLICCIDGTHFGHSVAPLPWHWPRVEGLPSQRAYIAIEDGYISTSDIEDEEDQDADEEDGEVLGDEATAAYRSIIVQRVLSS